MASERETYEIVNIRPSVHTKDAKEENKMDAITLDDDGVMTVHVPQQSHEFEIGDEVRVRGNPPNCELEPVR